MNLRSRVKINFAYTQNDRMIIDLAIPNRKGDPNETRHMIAKNYNAKVSPPWSIQAGSGTSNYGFV